MRLVTVEIITELGESYLFPDISKEIADTLFSERGIYDFQRIGSISLANISQAFLIVPFRIIGRILVDGVTVWASHASTATSP